MASATMKNANTKRRAKCATGRNLGANTTRNKTVSYATSAVKNYIMRAVRGSLFLLSKYSIMTTKIIHKIVE